MNTDVLVIGIGFLLCFASPFLFFSFSFLKRSKEDARWVLMALLMVAFVAALVQGIFPVIIKDAKEIPRNSVFYPILPK